MKNDNTMVYGKLHFEKDDSHSSGCYVITDDGKRYRITDGDTIDFLCDTEVNEDGFFGLNRGRTSCIDDAKRRGEKGTSWVPTTINHEDNGWMIWPDIFLLFEVENLGTVIIFYHEYPEKLEEILQMEGLGGLDDDGYEEVPLFIFDEDDDYEAQVRIDPNKLRNA